MYKCSSDVWECLYSCILEVQNCNQVQIFFFDYLQLFEWDKDNVIVTGSSDGIVRVSGNIVELQLNHSRTKTNCII